MCIRDRDKGFLIWIISLTYQSRESRIWACTTSFVHTCIYRMFSVFIPCLMYLSHVYMYLCSRHRFLCMLSDSDLSICMIYCHSFNFIYVTCHYLYMHAWTTSLDHVDVWLPEHATWLYYMYSRGCIWQPWVLMSRSWSLDRGGLAVPDQSGAAGAWISSCLFGPSFFQPPHDRLVRFSSYYSWVLSYISYCTSYFCAS